MFPGRPETAGVSGQESTGSWTRQPPLGSPGQAGMAMWGWMLRVQFLLPLGDLGQVMLFLALGFLICKMGMNPAALWNHF